MFIDKIMDFFPKRGGAHIYDDQYPEKEDIISQYQIDLKLHYNLWEIMENNNNFIIIRCKSIFDKKEKTMVIEKYGSRTFEVISIN